MSFLRLVVVCIFLFSSHYALSQTNRVARDTVLPNQTLSTSTVQVQLDSVNARLIRLLTSAEEKKEPFFMKLLPSLIALLTVGLSSFVSYQIGIRNMRVQKENTEESLKLQKAIAADQMEISRKQMELSASNTIRQVRANNLLQAKIAWHNELRKNITKLIYSIAKFDQLSTDLQSAPDEEKKEKITSAIKEETYTLMNIGTELLASLDRKSPEQYELMKVVINYVDTLQHNPAGLSEIADKEFFNKVEVVLAQTWDLALEEVKM